MRRMTRYGAGILWCAAVALVLCTGFARAATCEKWAGKVVSAQGVVEVKPAGETRWQTVKLNETYCPGDTIRTNRKSRADIALYNHPILRLDQNSTVTLGGMKDEKASLVDMLSGAALFFSRVTRNLEVRTATVNAGVEGTEFFIRVEEGKTDLTVFEGKVLASNAAGGLPVTTGQSAVAEAGKAPVYRVVVRPRDAVHWALYYPPVLDGRPPDLKKESDDPRFYTARASQQLAIGRVDEAIADIDKAQRFDPKNSDAFALRSIIAVTQNEKGKALELAQQGVTSDPKSATARIALSYAQQAHFNLPGALGSMEEAVKLSPENALAWARLAELQQSFGYLDKSLDSAKKAVALNPDLSRTQTVLGFSHLTRTETKEAREAFEKAIKFDDADPLPRLGLGLAKIRDGGLEDGRREIEIAMSLDPNNSLIRSYLGKAYFEEKRDKLASGQFEMAKSMDPSDPTPYFYDAIEKQITNRPVEAMRDVQKAIELNDNRLVYRSRLLLDSDVAAREASLARIYSDMGFQQLALVEGWKSVNTDPANYSSHRFLADSYSALPRHEVARVSELLQAQLLQPINISSLQPSLAVSNLFVVSGGGPSAPSFNEFNPLFERDRLALQANGIVGENSTWGEEVIASGLYKKVSASIGQYHFQTDGWRENNDLKDDIYSAFVQFSPTYKTSFQVEARYRDTEYGYLPYKFWPEDFLPGQRQEDTTKSIRVGFRQAFSPSSDLIGNFMYSSADNKFNDLSEIPEIFLQQKFAVKLEQDAGSGELAYLYRSGSINLVGGAGYFHIKSDTTANFDLSDTSTTPPTPIISSSDSADGKVDHTNAYGYLYVKYPKNVIFTLGASGDFYNGENQFGPGYSINENRFNPKFGLLWNPFVSTTVRAAVFSAFKRTLITNQTLEPTQVAGFNQFYDDPNGTKIWEYAIGVDQKITETLFGGAEFIYRNLDTPGVITPPPTEPQILQLAYFYWKEDLFRAYLNWTPHEWWALRAEYLYEKFYRETEWTVGIKNVTTQRVPLGVSFFHPSGLGANVQATYYDQSGDFNRISEPSFTVFESGEDTFWLVDAAINYRLPQRYGFITVGAKNLFDTSFRYYDTNPTNPTIQPDRMFYARLTLSF